MRKFIQIVSESITHDANLNQEIEAKLAQIPSAEDRTKVLDGLEIIYGAGATGLTISAWVAAMRNMWPKDDVSTDELKRIFKLMTHSFAGLVKRNPEGNYCFATIAANADDAVDMTSPTAQLAKHQIELTSKVQEMMRNAGTFSPSEIVVLLCQATGIDGSIAQPFVDHVIASSSASVKPNPDGTYRWVEPAKKTGLSFLQDLEGYEPAKHYDIKLHLEGSLLGIEALSEEGSDWIHANVHSEGYQWQGNILYIEARYGTDIVQGMEDDGLVIEKLVR